eukprot:COSAG05_NODE_7252_length_837_cov_0.669377_1_plen_95_part_10
MQRAKAMQELDLVMAPMPNIGIPVFICVHICEVSINRHLIAVPALKSCVSLDHGKCQRRFGGGRVDYHATITSTPMTNTSLDSSVDSFVNITIEY